MRKCHVLEPSNLRAAHGSRRQQDYSSHSAVLCGFTPVNTSPPPQAIDNQLDEFHPEKRSGPVVSGSASKTPIRKRKKPAVRLLTPPNTNKKFRQPPWQRVSIQDVQSSTAHTVTSSLPVSKLNYPRSSLSKGHPTSDDNDVNMDHELKANVGAKLSRKTLGKLAAYRYHGESPSDMPVSELFSERPDDIAPSEDLHHKPCGSTSPYACGRGNLLRKRSSDGDLYREVFATDMTKNTTRLNVRDDAGYQDVGFSTEEEFLLLNHQSCETTGNDKGLASCKTQYIPKQETSISILEDDRLASQKFTDDFPFDEEGELEELFQHTVVENTAAGPSAPRSLGNDRQTLREVRNPTLAYSTPLNISRIQYSYEHGKGIGAMDQTSLQEAQSSPTQLSSPLPSGFQPTMRLNVGEKLETLSEEDLISDDDDDWLEVAEQSCALTPQTPLNRSRIPSGPPKLQWNPPTVYTPACSTPRPWTLSSPTSVARSRSSPQLPAPSPTLTTPKDSQTSAKPFARPPFPSPALNRSPIQGLSSTPLLRTCFRIGEAFNAATQASRLSQDAIIELYARVTSSSRKAGIQHFQFADLFRPEKPPILIGSYEGWKGVELYEADARPFLVGVTGKMARAVGRLGREVVGGRLEWRMKVMSVWEVGWEDVEWVKGVVCVT